MTSEVRNIYIDSQHCENKEGMMTYPIPNNLEVLGQDIVAMVDDFTLAGNNQQRFSARIEDICD